MLIRVLYFCFFIYFSVLFITLYCTVWCFDATNTTIRQMLLYSFIKNFHLSVYLSVCLSVRLKYIFSNWKILTLHFNVCKTGKFGNFIYFEHTVFGNSLLFSTFASNQYLMPTEINQVEILYSLGFLFHYFIKFSIVIGFSMWSSYSFVCQPKHTHTMNWIKKKRKEKNQVIHFHDNNNAHWNCR